MIPSRRWFPVGLQERAAWFQNFFIQFSAVGTDLGFTADDIRTVDNDNQVMQFLADVAVQIKAFDDAVRQFRKIITEGDIGDPTPKFPANPTFSLPVEQPTGIFERLDKLVDRIRVAPNYTNEMGALLGILPSSSDPISPSEVQPTIQTSAAQTGYMFSIMVSNRADSDMWDVLILKKGGTWTKAGSFTGKSGDVTVVPTTAGEAEQIQVRVQLRKSNANYGQPSDIVYVTVNP